MKTEQAPLPAPATSTSDNEGETEVCRGAAGSVNLGRITYPTVRVGVTGHRDLPDEGRLAGKVGEVLDRICAATRVAEHTPVHLEAVSPLAEGADRMVARAILAREGGTLSVPLPFPEEDYVKTFPHTVGEFWAILSRARQVEVIQHPAFNQSPADSEKRHAAYSMVGRYVVDHSDVVIALWNGEGGKAGGTAEIVEYARERGVPLLVIPTAEPLPGSEPANEKSLQALGKAIHDRVKAESGPGPAERGTRPHAIAQVDQYNAVVIPESDLQAEVQRRSKRWEDRFRELGFDSPGPRAFVDWLVPYQVRASMIATHEQSLFQELGFLVFLLPAMAVAVAATEAVAGSILGDNQTHALLGGLVGMGAVLMLAVLAFPLLDSLDRHIVHRGKRSRRRPGLFPWLRGHRVLGVVLLVALVAWLAPLIRAAEILWQGGLKSGIVTGFLEGFEVGFLVVAVAGLVVGRWGKPNERWIVARFLAEHLRSRFFLVLIGEKEERLDAGAFPFLETPLDTWLQLTLDTIWASRPIQKLDSSPVANEAPDRIKRLLTDVWIAEQIQYHQEKAGNSSISHRWLNTGTQIAFGAALVCAVLHWVLGAHSSVGLVAGPFLWGALAIPAFAAAWQGIDIQREYERDAKRCGRMVGYLKGRQEIIQQANGLEAIQAAARDTEHIMLLENRFWFMIMQVHGVDH